MLKSIPKLSNVAMLCAFCFLVFGIVSVTRSNLFLDRGFIKDNEEALAQRVTTV